MQRRLKQLVLAGAVLAGGAGWYLFRPEKLFTTRSVSEAAPARATVERSGRFETRSHESHGLAEVVVLADGRRVLRLSDFATSDGPDLQVYLLANPAASRRAHLDAGFVSLGALKGNVGSQNYEIPAGTDLARYAAVSVWCRRFGVNFTTAVLAAPAS